MVEKTFFVLILRHTATVQTLDDVRLPDRRFYKADALWEMYESDGPWVASKAFYPVFKNHFSPV